MSTDHQIYSTQNQLDAIAAYAAARGIEIVKTFADEGKSGLRIAGRSALQAMIKEIEGREPGYSIVLVYDISRWGRFQDADESAYLEYICKMAGIRVLYCAEQFENDGSLAATIIKNVKRVMAGEYSRELSAKVFAGQARLVAMGFRQGGPAGHGLRRCLVDKDGKVKFTMEFGQQKSIQTDRVILVPGPPEEQATVRRVFKMFVEDRKSVGEIVKTLNREGIRTYRKGKWNNYKISWMLKNEKYIGNNVFNLFSSKLKSARVQNPPSLHVRSNGAFEAIVDSKTFAIAQEIIEQYSRPNLHAALFKSLKRSQRMLSLISIDDLRANVRVPSRAALRTQFGSLGKAYNSFSLEPNRDFRQSRYSPNLKLILTQELSRLSLEAQKAGATVYLKPCIGLIVINEELRVRVVVCKLRESPYEPSGWTLRFDRSSKTDLTLLVRLCANQKDIHDYHLLPQVDCPTKQVTLRPKNGPPFDRYHIQSPETALKIFERVKLRGSK